MTLLDFNRKVQLLDTVFAQEIDNEMVLLDMKTENYFGLDSVASEIWKLLEEDRTLQDTYTILFNMYDISADQLRDDLITFVNGLIESNLARLS